MLNIPQGYQKYDKKTYYVVFNYIANDMYDWDRYSIDTYIFYKSLENANKKLEKQPIKKMIKGSLKSLGKYFRNFSKDRLKLINFRNKERELFYAYKNCYKAQEINRKNIERIRKKRCRN